MANDVRTIVLGDEYDETLKAALKAVLQKSGAIGLENSWSVGGSQELESVKVKIGNDVITIESETFVGLTVSGPNEIVEALAQRVRAYLAI